MTEPESTDDLLVRTIDTIEASYEFMLAYAAQGRDYESPQADGPSIRRFVTELNEGLEAIDQAFARKIEAVFEPDSPARTALDAFRRQLGTDAEAARQAVQVVLSTPSINSQIVDNLNASAHLRCFLTDMFLLDEALRLHQRDSQEGKHS